jgi:superfamily II DNA/RNA helicase
MSELSIDPIASTGPLAEPGDTPVAKATDTAAFAALGLNPLMLKGLERSGYAEPSPVQREAVPAALAGRDLLVSSQTGSGKTAAFMLPSLQRMIEPSSASGIGPRVLVLTPTRELAQQVEQAARTYGAGLRRLRTVSLVGGAPFGPQLRMLSQPVDVVVATPGRLMDHMQRGRIDFSRLEVLVLDEADRMLDMGFIDDIQTIVARTPESRQTLLFSATLDGGVGNLARRLTRDPLRIEVAAPAREEARIEQRLLYADDGAHKGRLLDHLLRDVSLTQALVFTATKLGAEQLSDSLRGQGFTVDALHGDMHQNQRNRTLQRLRQGRTRILVATDVAARGIDVAGISHVINFDVPRQAEDYVHRIGRTGRAGRSGIAVTLAVHHERRIIRDIENYTSASLAVEIIPGLEPTPRPERSAPRPKRDWKPRAGEWKPRGGDKSYAADKSYATDKPRGEWKPAAKPAGEKREFRQGYGAAAKPARPGGGYNKSHAGKPRGW